jgi:hypothetical protein
MFTCKVYAALAATVALWLAHAPESLKKRYHVVASDPTEWLRLGEHAARQAAFPGRSDLKLMVHSKEKLAVLCSRDQQSLMY